MTGQTPGTASTPGALAAIDATVDGRCACGCGKELGPDAASAWFASEYCQLRWAGRRATDPGDVYRRDDAARTSLVDRADPPLTGSDRPSEFMPALVDPEVIRPVSDAERERVRRGFEQLRAGAEVWAAGMASAWRAFLDAAAILPDAGPGIVTAVPPASAAPLTAESVVDAMHRVLEQRDYRPASTSSPVRRIDRPPLPTGRDRDSRALAAAEPEWSPAEVARCPVRWVRHCAGCGRAVTPKTGIPPLAVVFDPAGPAEPFVTWPEVRNWCPACRVPFPGPPLLAQWREDGPRYAYVLRLGLHTPGCCGDVTYAVPVDSLPDFGDADVALGSIWAHLERGLLDRWVGGLWPCRVCPEPGRAWFRAVRPVPVEFSGAGFVTTMTVPAGDWPLCPQHGSDLLRAIGADGVPVVESPWPAPRDGGL